MHNYLKPLIEKLEQTRNPEIADGAKRYLKNKFEFLGTGTKLRRELIKNFLKTYGPPEMDRIGEFSTYLWAMPEREYQHVVLDVLHKYEKQLAKKDIIWIEKLIIQKSWWDTVDGLAAWICSAYFIKYPEQILPVTGIWMASGNMWLQRSSLLFQLKYKANTDTDLLANYILQLSEHKDFFIRKAIGWILREYSKTNKDWVRDFISKHTLSGLSNREAAKYI